MLKLPVPDDIRASKQQIKTTENKITNIAFTADTFTFSIFDSGAQDSQRR